VIAVCFGSCAPDALPAPGPVVSHDFKKFERLAKLATSSWRFTRTIANKVDIANLLKVLIPGIGISVSLNLPFQFALVDTAPTEVTSRYKMGWEPLFNRPLVSNAIGQVFGQLVRIGKGTIWLVPPCKDNALALNRH
jgi:hypothetical protein